MKAAYIITGTTRGIGRALAQEAVARGAMLYGISRAEEISEGQYRNYSCDLQRPEQIRTVMERLAAALGREHCDRIVLINNAGVLGPIGPIEHAADDQIERHLAVNLRAPILLIAHFLRGTAQCSASRHIINITSGAAENAYAGWGLYCTAKAGLNMLTACVALEQRGRNRPVSICAVAPGVVETDMQQEIRDVAESDFPKRPRFEKLHAKGELAKPQQVAGMLLDLDAAGLFDAGGLYDLRDVRQTPGGFTIAPRK